MTLHFSSISDMVLGKDVDQYEVTSSNIGVKFGNLAVSRLGLKEFPYEGFNNDWPDWNLETVLLYICGDMIIHTKNADIILKLLDDTDLHKNQTDVFIYEFENYESMIGYLEDYHEVN